MLYKTNTMCIDVCVYTLFTVSFLNVGNNVFQSMIIYKQTLCSICTITLFFLCNNHCILYCNLFGLVYAIKIIKVQMNIMDRNFSLQKFLQCIMQNV